MKAKKILSLLLAIVMVVGMLPMNTAAADANVYKGGAGTKISDLDTSMMFSESLGDNASTEYAGRIWSDKSVFTADATFPVFGGGTTTITLNKDNSGEDFLIAYSALATAQSISGATQAPVDVVFAIDISGSMSNAQSNMDNNKSRIYNTVVAVNNAIEELMALNEHTRVAVVAFSSTAQVLLPLDRYEKLTTVETTWVPGYPGRYEETTVTWDYFTLNRETASSNYANLTTRAVSTTTNTQINRTVDVEGGTNIQVGLYQSMKVLAEEHSTKANIDGASVQRVPSVVLLSDGSPTYSSGSASWWNPGNNNNDGPGSSSYAGNGMKAILVGAYMKDAIDRNYGVSNTAFATTVYTIGMGITGLDDTAKNLGYMTLDPGTYWNAPGTNSMKTAIKNYWNAYTANSNTGTTNINVGAYSAWSGYSDSWYTLTHPNTGYDVDPVDGYNYVDDYYDADNASAVTTVFKEIVSNISISAPQVPTQIEDGSHFTESGFITYEDPIGQYMEVKDIKAIIYAGETFTEKTTVKNGNVTTYTFAGAVHSPVYGDQDVGHIDINVTEHGDGTQTVNIAIPASVIPLRVNEVALNPDGTVKTHTNNGAMPARIVYAVGLKDEVTKQAKDGSFYIDKTQLSDSYLAANTNADGSVNFYSNRYTNMHEINGSTVGDAIVKFEPSDTNGFYYILTDMPIYKDASFTQQLSAAEGLDENAVYYYKVLYYHGNTVEEKAAARTGKQLHTLGIEIKTGEDGNLYRAAGSPRLNRILLFEGTKRYNNTNTAEDFYAPEFHLEEGSTEAFDGMFYVHLGNNGKLTAVTGGNLQITKNVSTGEGLTAPDKVFDFSVDLDGDEVNEGQYNYVITDASGAQVSTGSVSKTNTVVRLKDGQTATIFSLPPNTTYTVTEAAVPGFTTDSQGTSGTILAGQTSTASFRNTYTATPVVWPATNLSGTKELAGSREWSSEDSFTFFIIPFNNGPLPENYDAAQGITVSAPDAPGGRTATFDLGQIKFTTPGYYRYTVIEKEPENDGYLPGMTYSRALYRVEVTVEDNGEGVLQVVSSNIQKMYDDSANQLYTVGQNGEIIMNSGEEAQDAIKFVNTYSASDVTRVPVAMKDYTDNSGHNPLVTGMFQFELKALGYLDAAGTLVEDPSAAPMPDGHNNGVIRVSNVGHNVTFPAVTFTEDYILEGNATTYRYQMREVVPDTPVKGMAYDQTVYEVDVVVSVDPQSAVLNVSAIYPNDEYIATFKNTYTPTPVTADINGTKTLVGRDMQNGEEFVFTLSSADAATALAFQNGTIQIPSITATAKNGKDNVAKAFAFEDLTFTKPGTYTFAVTEEAGNNASITYDDSTITVTVVIVDDGGALKVDAITYSNGGNSADFTNTYESKFSGAGVSLSGTKTLVGKELLAGEFYFSIVEYYDGTQTGRRFVTHGAADSVTGDAYRGSFKVLDEATYDKAGVYEYVISEAIPSDQNKVGGTTYDTNAYRFTVVVTDDNNGNLFVSDTSLEKANGNQWVSANELNFENIYVPVPTTATLPLIKKVIDGDRSEPLREGEFSFALELVSANPSDGIQLPQTTVTANAANGDITFDALTFTKAGTYVVSVQEVIPADKAPGITYSEQSIVAVYHVTDDRNGNLTATLQQLHGGDNIVNLYRADPAQVAVNIEKSFTGRENDQWLQTDSFTFTVKIEDADTLAALEAGDIELVLDAGSADTATYRIAAKGDIATCNIVVNKAGTYKLVIRETDTGIPGVTYDSSEKELVLVATDNSAEAKIQVEINGVTKNSETVVFENEYASAASEPVSFTASKVVTPSSGNRYHFAGGEFSFAIQGSQGAPMPVNTTATNDRNGNVSFGSVQFTQPGTYRYTISEVPGNVGGITYDGEIYTVTCVVTHDYAAAKLVVDTTITNHSGEPAEIVFDNGYDPEETSAIIFGKKELNSEHKTLEADEFRFILTAVTAGAPMPVSAVATNTATGAFQFGAIPFTTVGTYVYQVTEQNQGNAGYTYDAASFTVTVTVTDNAGVLVASVDGVGTPEQPTVKFINSYTPKDVDLTIGAQGELRKELTGREMKAEEFVFAVMDSEGNEIATAKNTANGTYSFQLNFTKAGTYNYTIVEKDNKLPGVTYDKTVYDVEIVVSDNQAQLQVDGVTYSLADQPVNEVVFQNTYKATEADVVLTATKELDGRDLNADEFTFVLLDKEGKVVSTATNTASGEITFSKIAFPEAGTYTYTVYEEEGTLEHITYDKTKYVVEIVVTDDLNGTLVDAAPVITVEGNAATGIVFRNSYEDPDHPKTGDDSHLAFWFVLLFISTGAVITLFAFDAKKHRKANNR